MLFESLFNGIAETKHIILSNCGRLRAKMRARGGKHAAAATAEVVRSQMGRGATPAARRSAGR